MKWKFITATLLTTLLVASCGLGKKNSATADKAVNQSHYAQNSLDWNGTYRGILPSASGEGIETTVVLNLDLTYTYSTKYVGKSDLVTTIEGAFFWNEDNSGAITLTQNTDGTRLYFVEEGAIVHLDRDGKRIEGDLASMYRLQKVEQ